MAQCTQKWNFRSSRDKSHPLIVSTGLHKMQYTWPADLLSLRPGFESLGLMKFLLTCTIKFSIWSRPASHRATPASPPHPHCHGSPFWSGYFVVLYSLEWSSFHTIISPVSQRALHSSQLQPEADILISALLFNLVTFSEYALKSTEALIRMKPENSSVEPEWSSSKSFKGLQLNQRKSQSPYSFLQSPTWSGPCDLWLTSYHFPLLALPQSCSTLPKSRAFAQAACLVWKAFPRFCVACSLTAFASLLKCPFPRGPPWPSQFTTANFIFSTAHPFFCFSL